MRQRPARLRLIDRLMTCSHDLLFSALHVNSSKAVCTQKGSTDKEIIPIFFSFIFILHPSSFILHPSSFILHPSSFILLLRSSSFILLLRSSSSIFFDLLRSSSIFFDLLRSSSIFFDFLCFSSIFFDLEAPIPKDGRTEKGVAERKMVPAEDHVD